MLLVCPPDCSTKTLKKSKYSLTQPWCFNTHGLAFMWKMVTLQPTWRTVIKANCEWSYFKILCKKTNKQTIIKIFINNKTFIIFGGQLCDCPELDHVFLPTLGYLKKKTFMCRKVFKTNNLALYNQQWLYI